MTQGSKLREALDNLIANPSRTLSGPRCRVAQIVESLDDEDGAALLSVIGNTIVQATTLAATLKDLGIDIPSQSIQRHRRSACLCERGTP